MKKSVKLIIPLLAVIFLVGLILYYIDSNKTHWNDSFINGNTPGNLYNNGIFCEYDDTIYFSNPNDNHYLYSMDINGGNLKLLQTDVASYINADKHYVYYVRNNLGGDGTAFSFLYANSNSLCRYDLKTGKVLVLDPDPSIYASLIGNHIYYIHYDTATASSLYRVKIDGTEREQVDTNPYFTCSANGQYFYYNGIDNNHNIYQMDTSTGKKNIICQGNYWMPSAQNGTIYFLDCEKNYSLVKLGQGESVPTQITTDRVDCYNVYGDTIYFQRNNLDDSPALCRINTDGSNYQVIREGNFTNIQVTSNYVYFNEFGYDSIIYKTPTNGDGSVSLFSPN